LQFRLFKSGPSALKRFAPTAAPAQNWACISASADGTKLAAAGSYGYLYTSTNSGQTWAVATTTTNSPEPERPWTGLAGSADGSKLVAVANFSAVFLSTNFERSPFPLCSGTRQSLVRAPQSSQSNQRRSDERRYNLPLATWASKPETAPA
jgi:hypothetical protein